LAVFKMPSTMKIGCPVLRVRNIYKVLAFYEKNLGLYVSTRYHVDDDAWNSQDWDTFNKRHTDEVIVRWPGQSEPTRGLKWHHYW